jgi:hypothetical protein
LKVRELFNLGAEGRGSNPTAPAKDESQYDSGLTKARLDFQTRDRCRYAPEFEIPQL